VFDWLTNAVSGSPVTYLVVLLAAGGDVIIPLVPSETIVVSAGVLAAKGKLLIYLLVPAAALGAFIGDNIAYGLGRTGGDPVAARLFKGEDGRRRLEWAERAIQRHGGILIVAGRFIPGGRTASTFAAGTLEMPYRRFLIADVVAAVAWALFAAMLGFIGGSAFQDSSWKPFAASLAIATLITLSLEVFRRVQKRRGRDILGDRLET
jgi:membrane protein DedA with SNARE-associated domain